MGWARLDDSFHDHPKLIGLSLEALGLWTKCFTWAHRHANSQVVLGYLPVGLPATFAGKRANKLVDELVTHRLWDVELNLGGWQIHDYADYLPATERPTTAKEVRQARSDAGKRGAAARWGASQDDGKLLSNTDGKPMPPTRPDPNPIATTDVVAKTTAPSALEIVFEEAWTHWPKKVERKQALERFKAAAKKYPGDVEHLGHDVAVYGNAYAATTDRQFVPALGVWLAHERWTDELPQGARQHDRPTKTEQATDILEMGAEMLAEQKAIGQ